MKPIKKNGFTIVETMLFLGISGLLVVGVLVGVGGSINSQRYRDSVNSLKSFFRQQYSDVANISNYNSLNNCYGDGSDNPRGQSNCVLLGRYITSTDNPNELKIKNVLGYFNDTNDASFDNDIDAFLGYQIKISNVDEDEMTYSVEWNSLVKNEDNEGAKFSILIARSPFSSVIRTFINDEKAVEDSRVIIELLNEEALEKSLKLCVDSNGLSFNGAKMAVTIDKNANNASAIKTEGDNSGC